MVKIRDRIKYICVKAPIEQSMAEMIFLKLQLIKEGFQIKREREHS